MELYLKQFPYFDPMMLISRLPAQKDFVFLDSTTCLSANNKYSFIAYDPFSIISCRNGLVEIDNKFSKKSPLMVLTETLEYFSMPPSHVLPFTGGLVGYIGYEFINDIEPKIQLRKRDERDIPDFLLGAFDLLIAFDHLREHCWIISTGLPETKEGLRQARAKQRGDDLIDLIVSCDLYVPDNKSSFIEKSQIKANISYTHYCTSIEKVLNYIQAGDIYQANISQRFECELPRNLAPIRLYERLRKTNPAPFAAYISIKGNVIASTSPERFISVKDRYVSTYPIKGTAKRNVDPTQDTQSALKLSHCEKNRAENLMIVDLMRNDLAKVCELYSVSVSKLFSLESYATVHHLVSNIQGKLKKDHDLIDLIAATFPGGSVTGAPKKRAIEIIDEIEPHARGPYCGSIGYLGFDGTMDTSIVIRSFVIKNHKLTFHVGGGIIADSTPHGEYIETLIKANALYATLTGKEINFSDFIHSKHP